MAHTKHTYAAVALLAAASMLLEGTLLRLLAVAQFYHFAFLVVSLALLGFGASGSLLTASARLREVSTERLVALVGVSFSLAVVLAYAVLYLIPFDSYSIAFDRRQILYFVAQYLALTLPFVASGLGIGAALSAGAGRGHLVYAANLLGSAVGVLVVPLALAVAGVPGAVLLATLVGLGAALLLTRRPLLLAATLIGLLLFAGLALLNVLGRAPMLLTISPYKGLAQARQFPGSQSRFAGWNAVSRVDMLANAGTRQLPGLSYTYMDAPPLQMGLAQDAEAPQPVTLARPEDFAAAAYLPEAMAYSLRPNATVLLLGPGGGLAVLQALASHAERVTVALSNPLVHRAIVKTAPDADIYGHPAVTTVYDTPRSFIQRDQSNYDAVVIPLTDAYRPVTSGAYSLSETYDLTVEAFAAALARLAPNGLLVTTRWLQNPPSEEVRLLATVVEALEQRGVEEASEALVAFRGIQTLTVLAQPDGWEQEELEQIRDFAAARRYDMVWAPDLRPSEVNRFNRLSQPAVYLAARQLLQGADREAFYAASTFDVRPPTDNHPFFYHFFTWRQTPEVLANLGQTWQPFGGSGYLVLVAMLALVLVLSALLIIGPLLLPGRSSGHGVTPMGFGMRLPTLAYFSLLGLAFLFVEIPLIQRYILLLGHPVYAFTAAVTTLLLFSGIGSSLARASWLPARRVMGLLVLLALVTPLAIDRLMPVVLGLPLATRMLVAGLALAPLALLMGLPFPLGLGRLEDRDPGLIPWAWAVNGCASVVASVLAAMLALSQGFHLVLLMGAGAYGLAWIVLSTRVEA